MKIKIKKWGINGEGIAYMKKKPVFIPYVLPNEVIDGHIVEEKQKYMIGEMDRIIEKSSRRRYPICSQWQSCGGCSMMHAQYKEQCKMKEKLVEESLRKYTNYKGKVEKIRKNPNPLAYRNMCKLPLEKVNGQWKCGMYARDSHDFISIDRCIVHEKTLEAVRQGVLACINQFQLSDLKNLVIKTFDKKVQIILVTGQVDLPKELIDACMKLENVVSFWQSIKEKDSMDLFGEQMHCLAGQEKMEIQLKEKTCQLLPRSFFQLNTQQAIQLYEYVNQLTKPSDFLVEAYSGIGAISLFVADKAKEVIGIEYNKDAVENAQMNAKINGEEHLHFIAGDASEELEKIKKPIDTLIVDPPRKGLEQMVQVLLKKDIESIIYISCNPSTLAKDIKKLEKKYKIDKVQPFDLFSQTPHVETVVLLSKVQN